MRHWPKMMAENDVMDEVLQQFMDAVGGTFDDKTSLVKAMGVYRRRKRLRPDFKKGVFMKHESEQTADRLDKL